MTAHMEVPVLGTQKGFPVSLSQTVIEGRLRKDMKFGDGLVITDDLTGMGAITNRWPVARAIRMAIDAGNDMIVLAHPNALSDDSLTPSALKLLLTSLASEYASSQERIDISVRRILSAKLALRKTFRSDAWQTNEADLSNKLRTTQHLAAAQEIADDSIVLITEKGETIDKIARSRFFAEDNAPLKKVETGKEILTVSGVFYPPDLLQEEISKRGLHKQRHVRMVYGYAPASPLCKSIWNEVMPRSDDIAAIRKKADEILSVASGTSLIVFAIVKDWHVRVLKEVASRTSNEIIVLCLREPYLLDESVLGQSNITVLASASGVAPSIHSLVKALYGDVKPKPIGFLSVSVGNRANRESDIGAPIVVRTLPNENLQHKGGIGDLRLLTKTSLAAVLVLFVIGIGILVGIKIRNHKANWQALLSSVVLVLGSTGGAMSRLQGQTLAGYGIFFSSDGAMQFGLLPHLIIAAFWGFFLYVSTHFIIAGLAARYEIVVSIRNAVTSLKGYRYSCSLLAGMLGGFLGPSMVEALIMPVIKHFIR